MAALILGRGAVDLKQAVAKDYLQELFEDTDLMRVHAKHTFLV